MAQTTPDASLDAEIELKKRSRRRLVGATALALLAAVVLPMVMDHEPKPVGQDIQVRIPSQEAGGFASRILPTKPAATPLPPTENKAVADAAPTVAAANPEAAKVEPPKAEAKPEPAKADSTKAKAEAEAPKPAARPEAAAAATAEKPKTPEKPAAAKTEEARAAAAVAGGEQWVVQLGAYKEAGNVKTLVAKLKQLGVPTYTENFSSPNGARTRVRAGPFPSREAAEKAQVRIKIVGIDAPVAQK